MPGRGAAEEPLAARGRLDDRHLTVLRVVMRPGTVTGAGVLLARTRTVCVLPPGHELVARPVTYARDLHDQPFIALSREEGRQVLVDRALHAAGVRPRETPR